MLRCDNCGFESDKYTAGDGCPACETHATPHGHFRKPESYYCLEPHAEATNRPVPQVCSKDLLRRTAVVEAIESEPEYPDAEQFVGNVSTTIKEEFGVSDDLATVLADCLIMCARAAVKQTKEEISKRILAL